MFHELINLLHYLSIAIRFLNEARNHALIQPDTEPIYFIVPHWNLIGGIVYGQSTISYLTFMARDGKAYGQLKHHVAHEFYFGSLAIVVVDDEAASEPLFHFHPLHFGFWRNLIGLPDFIMPFDVR